MPIPFVNERFPVDVSYGSRGGPTFKTTVFEASSGAEQRQSLWAKARGKYNVSHGIRDKTDMDTVLSFFFNMRGKATAFRFKDWADYEVINQQIGIGNSVQTTFDIYKEYVTGAVTPYRRDILKIVPSTLLQMMVGTTTLNVTVDFTVDTSAGRVTFLAPPPSGEAVKVIRCEYDVPARFDTDEMPINHEAFLTESWNDIPIVEVRLARS